MGPRSDEVGIDGGLTDASALAEAVDDETAAVFLQSPNFLGAVEDIEELGEAARAHGALVIVATDPMTLGVLRPPGECGADVAVGEGQPLGNRLDYGGPSFGFFCAREEHIRRMPGRIAGETEDVDGRRGFVLALQTREQHIRREKATHNICTAQALNALGAMVHLAWLGRQGYRELGELLVRRTAYARQSAGRGRRGRAAARAPGGPGVRGDRRRAGRPGARLLRRARHRRRLPARARVPRIRERACWWRSPSAARARRSTGWRTCWVRRSSAAGQQPCARGGRRVSAQGTTPSPPMQQDKVLTIFERSRPGRRAAQIPDADVSGDAARGADPGEAPALRAAAPARGRRARDRPPLQPALASQLRPRLRLLPARLVHDEAQPAPQRAGRGAARPRPPASRRRSRAGPRARSS